MQTTETVKDNALRRLELIRYNAIKHPSMYSFPDPGLATQLCVLSHVLGMGEKVSHDQTHGIPLLQLIERLTQESYTS